MQFTTRKSIAFSIAARYVSLLVYFGSTMILARLLTPEDIGIYTAGFSVVALAQLFRDFGLNQYLIQERDLDRDKIASAFTLTIILSWLLGAVLALISGAVARFFGEPGISPLLKLLSINFLIIPFGSITLALLRKALRFHITSSIAVIASLVGVVVSVVTALQGARYFCLAYGAIAESLCMVLGSLWFRDPRLTFRLGLRGAGPILKFGSIIGVGNIIHRLSISGTDAMVARFMGLSALGFFSRAYGTFSLFGRLFTGSVSSVILPLFSRDNHDTEALARGYLKSLHYAIVFAWPFFAFLYVYTAEIILLLYGDQWGEAVALVKVLCLGGLLLPPILFSDNLFVAFGKPEITLKIRASANLIKLALVAVACQYSLLAVCFALVGFHAVKLVVSLYYLRLTLGVGMTSIAKSALHALPCLVGAMLPAVIVGQYLLDSQLGLVLSMLLICAATAVGWLAGLLISKHPFSEEIYAMMSKLPGLRSFRSGGR
ncbi:lipopolysaccharide biosynthesis protein [Parahaliea aestuarii]|uniref:Lipopolysaccharide biosynthesis protein n=1 Tax=Parahaliea aestuarii TaxID=1852021 RepID=A0A5C8ZPP6_9GAMM|nr:lipopolysaccharide biosynthesis protein [Parahaliea aestuarii]TXS89629.1 lipopolysaccharide biosynthesis protein [Parahaliea aestuarii]